MTWIEYKMAVKGHAAGEIVEVDDAVATNLVELEVAKKTAAPAEVTTAATELKGTLAEFVKTAVADGFSELRKSLPAQKRMTHNVADGGDVADTHKIPATVKRWSALRNFTGPDAEQKAYRFGTFVLGMYAADPTNTNRGTGNALKRCKELGIPLNDRFLDDVDGKAAGTGQVENSNSAGGFLVPPEFQDDLVDLRETFGIFRKNAKIVPMKSDVRSDPRRRAGLPAYFAGEAQTVAESVKSWDNVNLTAKKLMVLARYSNELNEDAVINIGDDLAGEIAYAFALKEDQCGFVGDSTSTYGGIQGVTTKLKNVSATIANIMGLQVATGSGYASSYGAIVLGDLNATLGRLPQYAYMSGDVKWYCSQYFWGSVLQKLAVATGGNRVADIVDGVVQYNFLGFPVEISQVMPSTPAINQVVCLFGNLRKAASMGTRRDTTLMVSEHAYDAFQNDQVMIRGTERFDINVHDVGEDSSATPRDTALGRTQAGPIVGLITSAS